MLDRKRSSDLGLRVGKSSLPSFFLLVHAAQVFLSIASCMLRLLFVKRARSFSFSYAFRSVSLVVPGTFPLCDSSFFHVTVGYVRVRGLSDAGRHEAGSYLTCPVLFLFPFLFFSRGRRGYFFFHMSKSFFVDHRRPPWPAIATITLRSV